MHALKLETYQLSKRFGDFAALSQVSLTVRPGSVHALLGENGAGKSTFVKCLVGYYRQDEGALLIDDRERVIASPVDARAAGIGMVYQHFTVAPGMTVAENLLLARGQLPARIHWPSARAELKTFMEQAPFSLDLDAMPVDLSAGQKQKLEILKQMLLRPRLLILDEPTSVLTPQEADEVLGALRARAHAGECSIILITHKFREVSAFADDVTVLRRGHLITTRSVAGSTSAELARAMVGGQHEDVSNPGTPPTPSMQAAAANPAPAPALEDQALALQVVGLKVLGDRGQWAIRDLSLDIGRGEILGVAGISGNGQRELLQSLIGQRPREAGSVSAIGHPYDGSRKLNRILGVRSLPEEPLANACVPGMSVLQNMALRDFDVAPACSGFWVRWGRLRQTAIKWIERYRIKTAGEFAPIESLSGGNVQRTVLARELSSDARLLLVSNPSFGLDFAATAEVHNRLREARERGAGVLLISEDLDELLALSDRIVVMSDGRIVYTVSARHADRQTLGSHMAGDSHHSLKAA